MYIFGLRLDAEVHFKTNTNNDNTSILKHEVLCNLGGGVVKRKTSTNGRRRRRRVFLHFKIRKTFRAIYVYCK